MNRLENQFLAESYSPVGCATTEPPAEIEKAGNKTKNKQAKKKKEPSHQKRKQEKGMTRRTAAVEQENVARRENKRRNPIAGSIYDFSPV